MSPRLLLPRREKHFELGNFSNETKPAPTPRTSLSSTNLVLC
jgi:hypothetical protein